MIQLDNAVSRYNKIILTELKDAEIKCWLAGGALRDYFMGVPIKTDHDIFFPDEDNYEKCRKYFLKKEAFVKWQSPNGMKVIYNKRTFDLIKHYFPGWININGPDSWEKNEWVWVITTETLSTTGRP